VNNITEEELYEAIKEVYEKVSVYGYDGCENDDECFREIAIAIKRMI
jgi:hypothetical protein